MKTTFCLASLLLFAFGLRADTNPVFKCQVKVVDAQGRPVSGAVVERFLRKMLVPGDPLPPDGRDTTDSNGIVSLTTTNHSYYAGFANPSLLEIEGLPRGRRYSVNASAKGFGQDTKTVEASDSATNRVELEILQLVLANLKIAGVVLDADDKPVPGAFINGYGNPKQAQVNGQTDSKGRFSFGHICPGTINLSANHPRGGASGTVSAEAGDTNITLRLDSQEAVLGLPNSNSGRKINGTVLDTNGKPAPKVVVSLYPYFSYVQKKTDEAGRFVLSPDPNQPNGIGNQRVIVARDTDRELAATLDLEEDATNVTLHLAPAFTLVGHAVDINGKPLAKAQAQLLFRTDRMSSTLGSSVRADEEGRFEIKGLPANRGFSVTVTAKGYGQDSHNADTGEGGNRRLELDPFQLLVADQRVAGVVLDADDKPVSGSWLYCYGDKQAGQSGQSDSKGRFFFTNICSGAVRFSANSQTGGFGSAEAEAGDTNVTIHLGNSGIRRASSPALSTLRGKPLPDLADAGLDAAATPADQAVLALLIDAEQRPCRRILRLLGDQAPTLKEKGVAVVVLHSGEMAEDAFTSWKQECAAPFPIARLKQDPGKARAAWGAGALPWLILTDKSHRVIAEGFTLDDLDAKLGEIK